MSGRPGRLITFEGGEGAGKSTQLARLAGALEEAGLTVLRTREPGGSPGAERIRRLLVDGEPGSWDGLTEALLVSAARRDHLRSAVEPALARGEWVLCDRFVDSTIAYQGHGRGVPIETLRALTQLAIGDLVPDLTILLDIDSTAGLARAHGRAASAGDEGTRFERLDPAFHERVRQGFIALARAEPARMVVVDASRPLETVAEDVLAAVRDRLSWPTRG